LKVIGNRVNRGQTFLSMAHGDIGATGDENGSEGGRVILSVR
jgi:hypothetical protein